jgi:DNA primase large subunit
MEVSLKQLFEKYMPLNSNTAHAGRVIQLDEERKKDHYSHFILRLAFCRSYLPSQNLLMHNCREELRRRFVRAETMLFR